MKLNRILLAAALSALPALPQTNSNPAHVELQRAIRKETVDGDLRGAIDLYRRLAGKSSDPAVAAQALLRLAECHEKQGSAEAKRTYEELLRRYPNRQEATLARRRLGGNDAPAGSLTVRKLWDGPKYGNTGRPSPDGRYISFTRWVGNAELGVYDTATGQDWDVTKRTGTQYTMAMDGIFSPDSAEIAYSWHNADGTVEVRVVPRTGGSSKTVFKGGRQYVQPYAWSKDKKRILARLSEDNALVWISVADGSVMRLANMTGKGGNRRAYLSPDGKYVAFERMKEGSNADLDVILIAADGGTEVPLIAQPNLEFVLGWTPAGDQILIGSNGTGSISAWLIPVRDGRPNGDPVLVKDHMGDVIPMDFDSKGTLYYNVNPGGTHRVYLAELDTVSGQITQPSLINAKHLRGSWRPVFSPNGDSLVLHRMARQGGTVPAGPVVFDLATGTEKETDLPGVAIYHWRGDGTLMGLRRKGEGQVFVTVPFDGKAPVEIDLAKTPVNMACSGYRVANLLETRERSFYTDLNSGSRLVTPFVANELRFQFSPDCSQVAWVKDNVLFVAAAKDGATASELLRAPAGQQLSDEQGSLLWSPDGKHIYYVQYRDYFTDYEVWRAPLEGRNPIFTGLRMPNLLHLTTNPAGNRIAFSSVRWNYEAWAVENILPRKQTARR